MDFDPRIAEAMIATNSKGEGIHRWLGIEFTEFTAERLVAELEVRDELLTAFGNMHGGVVAAMVDHVLGCVLYPYMPRGAWAATTEFKLNYLAPVKGGRLVATSRVLSQTKRTAVISVEVTNEGRPVCVAQGTLLVQEPKPRD